MAMQNVKSLESIIIDSINKNINDFIQRNRDDVQRLPAHLKELILEKLTRLPYYIRNSDHHEMFRIFLHKNLKAVDLTYVQTDDKLLGLFDICTELRDIRFACTENSNVTTEGLCKFLENKKKLRMLQLPNCQAVNDEVINIIVDNCPDLNGLDVRGCIYLTDFGMENLASMNNLMRLDFSKTLVTDVGLTALSKGNSREKIVELRIACCPKVTFHLLTEVIKNCVNLEVFEFHRCKQSRKEVRMEVELLETMNLKRIKQLTFTIPW